MSRSPWRAIVGLILAPYLVLSTTLAPEHLHGVDADHSQSIVHAHLQPHQIESFDLDDPYLDHDEGHLVWLGNVQMHQPTYRFAVPVAEAADARFDFAPTVTDWTATPSDNGAPAHGPPRPCSSLRGPPSLCLV